VINDIPTAPLPTLPVYPPPKERVPAALPKGLEVTKMPTTLNKVISRMLAPKMKAKLPNKMKPAVKPKSKTRMKLTTKNRKKGIQIV
jgi:hypothetical protein